MSCSFTDLVVAAGTQELTHVANARTPSSVGFNSDATVPSATEENTVAFSVASDLEDATREASWYVHPSLAFFEDFSSDACRRCDSLSSSVAADDAGPVSCEAGLPPSTYGRTHLLGVAQLSCETEEKRDFCAGSAEYTVPIPGPAHSSSRLRITETQAPRSTKICREQGTSMLVV